MDEILQVHMRRHKLSCINCEGFGEDRIMPIGEIYFPFVTEIKCSTECHEKVTSNFQGPLEKPQAAAERAATSMPSLNGA